MNWKRLENTLEITRKLKQQVVPTNVFVWNNNPDMLYEDPNADLIINSNRNIRCGASLLLMPYVMEGCVVKLDDDLIPTSNQASQSILDQLERAETMAQCPAVIGLASEHWYPNGTQRNSTTLEKVDSVKGRLWATRRKTLNNLSSFDIFKKDNEQSHHWEMPITAALSKQGVSFYNTPDLFNYFTDRPIEEVSCFWESSHVPNRNALRRKYYKDIKND